MFNLRSLSALLSAAVFVCVTSGCVSTAMTELAREQGKQSDDIAEMRNILKKQSEDIAALRKAVDNNSQTLGASEQDKLFDAALLLANSCPDNLSRQAIDILGNLGGKKAEPILLKMLEANPGRCDSILRALGNINPSKLHDLVLEYLENGNTQQRNAAINILQNNSLNMVRKSDLPILEKALVNIPDNDYNSNRYHRRTILETILRLDEEKGVEYFCETLQELTQPHQRRESAYMLGRHDISISLGSWKKIIKYMGEPDASNLEGYGAFLNGMSRAGDWRITDIILPWAEFASTNDNFRSQYISALSQLKDPKSAKVLLELYSDGKNFDRHMSYLNNYPGITKNDKGNYVLVDDGTMKKLLEKREEKIRRLNERDKKQTAEKK